MMKILLFFTLVLSLIDCPPSLLETKAFFDCPPSLVDIEPRFESMEKLYENLGEVVPLFKCTPLNSIRPDNVMITVTSPSGDLALWVEDCKLGKDHIGLMQAHELHGICSGIGKSPDDILEIKGPDKQLYYFPVSEETVAILREAEQEANLTKYSAYKILQNLGIPLYKYSSLKKFDMVLSL